MNFDTEIKCRHLTIKFLVFEIFVLFFTVFTNYLHLFHKLFTFLQKEIVSLFLANMRSESIGAMCEKKN